VPNETSSSYRAFRDPSTPLLTNFPRLGFLPLTPSTFQKRSQTRSSPHLGSLSLISHAVHQSIPHRLFPNVIRPFCSRTFRETSTKPPRCSYSTFFTSPRREAFAKSLLLSLVRSFCLGRLSGKHRYHQLRSFSSRVSPYLPPSALSQETVYFSLYLVLSPSPERALALS